jgi:hypothetical protein
MQVNCEGKNSSLHRNHTNSYSIPELGLSYIKTLNGRRKVHCDTKIYMQINSANLPCATIRLIRRVLDGKYVVVNFVHEYERMRTFNHCRRVINSKTFKQSNLHNFITKISAEGKLPGYHCAAELSLTRGFKVTFPNFTLSTGVRKGRGVGTSGTPGTQYFGECPHTSPKLIGSEWPEIGAERGWGKEGRNIICTV